VQPVTSSLTVPLFFLHFLLTETNVRDVVAKFELQVLF